MNSEAFEVVGVKVGSLKERLQKSLAIIAYLIGKGNDEFWPIFELLEDELIQLEKRQSRLSRYSNDKKVST